MMSRPKADDDQALAILRDAGRPMLSREVAEAFPRQKSPPKCGHRDCTWPEHQQWRYYIGLHTDEARYVLSRLAKQGKVRKIPRSPGQRVQWEYIDEEARREIAELEGAFHEA